MTDTPRDLLMRTRRLFTAGQWTRRTLRSSYEKDGEVIDLFCLIGGLRHSAGFSAGQQPNEDNKAYWDAVALLAGGDIHPAHSYTMETVVAYRNDKARGVNEVIAMIDSAVEEAS